LAFVYAVVGVLEGREPLTAEVEESEASEEANQREGVPADDQQEEPDHKSG
jgi:hypothetical protein